MKNKEIKRILQRLNLGSELTPNEFCYLKEYIKYECDDAFSGMQFYSYHLYDFNKEDLLRMLGEIDEHR